MFVSFIFQSITVYILANFNISPKNAIKTDDLACCVSSVQIYKYEKARGSGFRCQDACDFAFKPEDGRNVNEFSCTVRFQQEGDDEEHSFDVHPGFTPLKVEKNTRSSTGSLLMFSFCVCV